MEPFDPPYVLGGSVVVVIGALSDEPALPADLPSGFRVVRAFGRTIAVVVGARYSEPPAEMPVRYDEVIVSVIVRRGLRLLSLPLTMQLDEQLPVTMGHLHYALPKTFDASADVIADGDPRVVASGVDVEGDVLGGWRRALALLPSVAVAIGVRAFTACVPVLGVADRPHRRAIVALGPRGIGRAFHVRRATLPYGELSAWWAQSFPRARTWLGPPH